MTVEQAARNVVSKLDGMMAVEAHEAPDAFLIVCVKKNSDGRLFDDYSGASYLVNKKTGAVAHFNPSMNPEVYSKMLSSTENLIHNPIV